MNKWTLKSLAAGVLSVVAFAGQANAAVSYSYVAEQSPYNATPNQAIDVKLYLLETLTGSPASASVVAADGGLFSAGIRVTRTGGDAAITGSTLNLAATPVGTPETGFGGPSQKDATTPTSASFTVAISPDADAGVPLGNTGNGASASYANRVYLGSVSLNAGSGGTFSVTAYSPNGGNTLDNAGNDLDTNSNNPAFIGAVNNPSSFQVIVPEPTFAGIAVVVGAVGSMIRRRRMA